MVHHGKKIEEIAMKKGFKKSNLAKLLDKTHQAISYDLSRQSISNETLIKYAKILQVDINEFYKDSEQIFTSEVSSKAPEIYSVEKLIELMEENRKLWSVIARHGIAVNFNSGVPVSVFGVSKYNNFFVKRTQKRIHP